MAGHRVSDRRYFGVQRSPRLMDGNHMAYFRTMRLGSFVTPEEAAFAHNHAALVLDGTDSPPNAIPSDRMPDRERQLAIKATVEECVRRTDVAVSLLRPNPQSAKCASGYMAVSATRPSGKWEARVTWHGRRVVLGYYESKHEAAYAYNYVVELLGDQTAPTNVIPIDLLPRPERRVEIHGLVEHLLHQFGVVPTNAAFSDRAVKISSISKTSGYRGVRSVNKDSQWIAYLVRDERTIDLGHYAIKHEAAFAFNHAVHILRADHVPLNQISPADLPALEHQALIELSVEQRLWKHDLIQQQPPRGDYAEYLIRHFGRLGYRGVKPHVAGKSWRVTVPCQGKIITIGYFKTEHEGAFAFNHAAQVLGLPDWLKNPIADVHTPDLTSRQRIQAKVENNVLNGRAPSSPGFIPEGDRPAEIPTAMTPVTGPSLDHQNDALDLAFHTDSPTNDALVAPETECHLLFE